MSGIPLRLKSALLRWGRWLMRPAIVIANRWTYTQKAVTASMVVMAIFGAAAMFLSHTLSREIDATRQERAAILRLTSLLDLWRDVVASRARNDGAAHQAGYIGPQNVIARMRAVIDQVAMNSVESEPMREAAKVISLLPETGARESRFIAYTKLSRAILARIEAESRKSGMLGDPDINLAALTMTRELPSLIENETKQIAVAGTRNQELKDLSMSAQLLVLDHMDRTSVGVAQIVGFEAAPHAMESKLQALQVAVWRIDEILNRDAENPHQQEAMAQVGTGYSLLNAMAQTMDVHLARRVERQTSIRRILMSILAVLVLGTAYGALGTILAIRHALQSLTEGTQAFCAGQMDVRIEIASRDEFSYIAKNFNKIAREFGQLLADFQAQSEQSQERLRIQVDERTKELSAVNRQLSESIETLKAAEEELVRAEKMAALGRLVAGVAHEVNTPIGLSYTMTTHLQDKLRELEDKFSSGQLRTDDFAQFLEQARDSLQHASRNLQRASKLVENFKKVAVDQASDERRSFDLETYLREIISSLHSVLRKGGHEVSIEVPAKLVFDSYPGAFSQVITNLVVNAVIHGFEGRSGGRIRIAADAQPGGRCRLVVSDDGVGLAAEVAKRLFEPFVTTKRGQGGSGLGLHIVYNLVTQRLGGSIACDKSKGTGTTFSIVLPLVGPGAANASIGDGQNT